MTATGDLLIVLTSLGEDERRVLLEIAKRLAMGQKAYGALDIHGDPRDWRKEAADEALDLAVYSACQALRQAGEQPKKADRT